MRWVEAACRGVHGVHLARLDQVWAVFRMIVFCEWRIDHEITHVTCWCSKSLL